MTGMMTQEFFAAAYQKGRQATIRLLMSKGTSIEEAEELAQASWVRGWEARQQLKKADRIVSWVNSIAMNTLFSEKRRSKRFFEELDETSERHAVSVPMVDQIDATKLLGRCSELDRSLLLHRFAGGYEMEDIASIHGMTGVATRVRIHRAKAALRRFAERPTVPLAA